MSVYIPCAKLLLRKPHDNNESIEFLTQIRQTKHRTNRTENQHERATNRFWCPSLARAQTLFSSVAMCKLTFDSESNSFSLITSSLRICSVENFDMALQSLSRALRLSGASGNTPFLAFSMYSRAFANNAPHGILTCPSFS